MHAPAPPFTQTVKGIIAAQSPILATGHDGAQRILRMATDESTRRSQVEVAQLTASCASAVEQLATAPADELWLIADGSDLRKPHAQAMPHLMQMRTLEGGFVNGYRTFTVVGVTP